jgi:sensor c-di-GMP phosphodiesterase-like protein
MGMSAVVNALIAGRHQRFLLGLLWCALYCGLLAMGYGFVLWQIGSDIRRDHEAELGRLAEIHGFVVSSLQRLEREATAPPCSRLFLTQMQTVAFLADGLNEFLYAPNGLVQCSTSQSKFDGPISLGAPDVKGASSGEPDLWIDRDLESIGRSGISGTFAKLGSFAVAIPPYSHFQNDWPWLQKEIVAVGQAGKVWNVAGMHGVYQNLSKPARLDLVHNFTTISRVQCDDQHVYCVASEGDLLAWGRSWITILSSVSVLAGLFAWVCAFDMIAWLNRYWSFEARFSRYLSTESVVVAYQPILDLRSGKISGCEVLARWRDVDGTIVSPDRFIGIIERKGRTAAFTQMIVDKAYAEITERFPAELSLQFNFNIFACDFNSKTLLRIFSRFIESENRRTIAVELVESDQVDFENAQLAIEELGRAGIKTYIDDFGTGYSSIERLATLPVEGVKLDRSFAMAPPDSILGRMLGHILELIKTSERSIIVEGVETEARLNSLRASDTVDYIQGYVLSRPVSIDEFAAFLETHGTPGGSKQLAA